MPVAWLFNLDAERELASPTGYGPPSAALRATFARLEVEGRLASLLGPGDVVVRLDDRGAPTRLPRADWAGRAWCPTDDARRVLARAGAVPEAAPSMAVLRRVNDRAFCADLGQTLPGAAFLRREDAILARLAAPPPVGARDWLLKRPYGFAGRGRRKIAAGAPDDGERRWIRASLRTEGGLQVEPWLARELDVALHGVLDEDGALRLGRVTVQDCDETGAWRGTRVAAKDELTAAERDALVAATRDAANALRAAGYFGPFGVDGYRYRDGRGAAGFQPRGEINARYSMGWATGCGDAVDGISPRPAFG